jgi:glutamine synthetase
MIRTAGPGHFEDRTVSAGCNPYLALAAYVAAGIDGIENRIDPGFPNLENMYEKSLGEILEQGTQILPQSLPEAIAGLRDDEVVRSALGVIAPEFVELKTKESATYDAQVTRWEIDEYLTFF